MSKSAFGQFARGGAWRAGRWLAAILLLLPLRSGIAQAPPEPAVNAAADAK